MTTEPDDKFMRRCFELASLAHNQTGRNPKVGALLTYNGQVIGEGYHRQYGGPHAEVEALANVKPHEKHLIPFSTMYVSLEPCSHHGKTPPCATRIIREGIKKVVVGCPDPNPQVSGAGIDFLVKNGTEVLFSPLHKEAKELIRPFTANLAGLPYIILKWASSRDGFIGKEGEQIWMTNIYSKMLVHKWRAESDGILIGKNTLLTDTPGLNVRETTGSDPAKIVADRSLTSLPFIHEKYPCQPWIILNQKQEGQHGNLRLVKYDSDTALVSAFRSLFGLGINTLLVEGGRQLLTSLITAGLWHEARVFSTEHMLKEGIPAPLLSGRLKEARLIGQDKLHIIDNPGLHYD